MLCRFLLQPGSHSSSPTGRLNLGFITEGNTCCCLHHHLPLGVSQLLCHQEFLPPSTFAESIKNFWRRCRGDEVVSWKFALFPYSKHQQRISGTVGKEKISTRGVLHIQSLYFVFVLLSFFCFVLFASFEKHKKKLVSFLVVVLFAWF